MSDFKFKIGQTVTHAAFPVHVQLERATWMDGKPMRFFIVSRLFEECPGGSQRHYDCRLILNDGQGFAPNLARLNEVELAELSTVEPSDKNNYALIRSLVEHYV